LFLWLVKKSKPGQKKKQPVTMQPGKKEKKSFHLFLYALPVLVITFICFFPCIKNGLTNWDDPTYLAGNPLIRSLSGENIKRIFTEIYFANYQPLHIFSYAIEYHFFKLNPAGYHAVSIIMHVINTGLVIWLAGLLLENKTGAALTGFLFGINPLRVESVAWASERKDLLYALFFFLSLIYYIRYVKDTAMQKWFYMSLLFFVLSIFSKTMAASLPPALIIIDLFYKRKFSRKLIFEKIPFFIIAIVMGIVSVKAAATSESITDMSKYTFMERLLFAGTNLVQYIYKLFVPVNLSAYYPYPQKLSGSLPPVYFIFPVFSTLLIGYLMYALKKAKGNMVWLGLSFYFISIVLVLQMLPVGPTIFSERYSYIPSAGIFLLVSYFIIKFFDKENTLSKFKNSVVAVMAAYCMVLSYLTFNRCKVWKDSITLFSNVLEQFPYAVHAINNRADAYYRLGKYNEAIDDFNKAIQLNPGYAMSYYNRANCYGQTGRFKESLEDLNNSLRLNPEYGDAYNKRGQANAMLGKMNEAFSDFNKAVKLVPGNPEVYYNLGITYYNSGKKAEACRELRKAALMNFEMAAKAYNDLCK
jgi:protein O-mannosyl-transferase